ncbi:prostaglandin E2 receptor EP1 subtype-like protein, partial [Lates japonicus]
MGNNLKQCLSHQRPGSKATFLLFATSLVVTDFISRDPWCPGSRLYLHEVCAQTTTLVMACAVHEWQHGVLGLCPLFMGCAMAARRCLGVTKPLLHSSLVTKTALKICLSVIWLAALECGPALLSCWALMPTRTQGPGVSINPAQEAAQLHPPAKSHDIEMVGTLVGIMVTSCVCWAL